jgi:hypothetical protein
METIFFTKVKEEGSRTFYKCSLPILKCKDGEDAEQALQSSYNRLKDECKHLHVKQIEHVSVSTAHTHPEKLLFMAFKNGDNYCHNTHAWLAGDWQPMDGSGVLVPDEDLLREAAKISGYEYGGINEADSEERG